MSETPMKKQALLIGINEYQILPGLKYARQDAEAVADALKQNYCFTDDEVMLLTDARPGFFKPSNRRIIEKHLKQLASQDLDLFIFGFWGHGLFRNGQRFFCPLDTISEDVEELGLSFDSLQQLLSGIKAKNTCMILDCCQTFHDRGEVETLTVQEQEIIENAARDIVLRRKSQIPDFQPNVAILNSCKEGQSAYEWDDREHGLFTAHLLDAMKNRCNSILQIVSYISSNIGKTASELGKEQTPFYKLEGDINLPVSDLTPLEPGDVFISYRHCNADLVVPVEEELKRRGITYFIDRDGVKYSMDYSTVIGKAIEACKVLLVVWTNDAKDSPDILQEITTAKTYGRHICPYKLGTFNIKEHHALCYQLSSLSRCEAVAPTPDSVTKLVNHIQQLLKLPAPNPTDPSLEPIPPVPDSTPIPPVTDDDDFIKGAILKTQKEIQNMIREAQEMFKRKDFSNAIATLDIVLKLDPDSAEAKQMKSLSQINLELQKENEIREANKRDLSIPGNMAGEKKVVIVNNLEFPFRWCPPGSFMMGTPMGEDGQYNNEEKQHHVALTEGFWMMETEVTLGMFSAFVNDSDYESKGEAPYVYVNGNWEQDPRYSWQNPGFVQDDNHPVTCVSWNDAVEFCKWLSNKTGQNITLPTEAQWEYACRAGSTTEYFWGNDLNGDKANCNGNYPYGTTTPGKYLESTTPVGSYKPNQWGLFDMHGNVYEWCADWYGDYQDRSETDPTGPSSGSSRVYRGGSWLHSARFCRSAFRNFSDSGNRLSVVGLRVVRGV